MGHLVIDRWRQSAQLGRVASGNHWSYIIGISHLSFRSSACILAMEQRRFEMTNEKWQMIYGKLWQMIPAPVCCSCSFPCHPSQLRRLELRTHRYQVGGGSVLA